MCGIRSSYTSGITKWYHKVVSQGGITRWYHKVVLQSGKLILEHSHSTWDKYNAVVTSSKTDSSV